jgi:cephalosporin-C deacetylase-like acetyl esterase/lysophospholipase L1-like esterase
MTRITLPFSVARTKSTAQALFRMEAALRVFGIAAITLVAASVCTAQQLTLTPFNPTGIYRIGERAGWTASLAKGASAAGYSYRVKKNDQAIIKSGALEFIDGKASIQVTLDEPAMLYLEVFRSSGGNQMTDKLAAGAAIAPDKLRSSVRRPADFDRFWNSKIKMLNAIPENAVLTPADGGKPGVEYATIKMDHVNGAHVYGQLAKPNKPGKFPALVIFQWASPPYPLQKQWVTDRAAEGWLALNIEPHDVLPDQPQSYYNALPTELKNYHTIGRDDRDKNYFLQMYLADYRAVDYITRRPDWDGKTLVVMGTSMGGQQSLCVAGLHPRITHLIVNVPSGCDTNGPLHGRASGYPNWPADNPKIMQTALYFDPVSFAPHIRASCLVAMGFIDTVSPPAGIWIAFNRIRGPKEAVPMIDSPHNHLATPEQLRPYTSRSAEWLNALVHGATIRFDRKRSTSANRKHGRRDAIDNKTEGGSIQPIQRSDRQSQLAHEQLVQKARAGRIDVYFLGDSITRRWGTSDPEYSDLLANWRKNFFGWNAANFGWGGDTVQNILWRLENGELDGVNPKVIVMLGGTNNIGNAALAGNDDSRVTEVVHGLKAILGVCRRKARNATIVLMGLTPRNDNMALMPIINEINKRISRFAAGRKIRYLNINDKLADANGEFYDRMSNPDKLHLALKAYQVWADALRPILTELLGPRAKQDLAPAPTGAPRG